MKTTISTRAFALVCLFCLSAVGLWSTPLLNNWSFLSEDYIMSTNNPSYWGRSVYVLSNPDIWLEQDDSEEVSASAVMAITVNVFNDYDSDGTDDGAGEPGVPGLTVTAFDASNTPTVLADGGNGSYTFTPGNSNTYRIEVTGLGELEPSVAGTTTVFFASVNDVVNVGVHRPGEHYPESIFIATPCYVEGGTDGPNADGDVMVIVPGNSLTAGAGNVNPTEYFVANHDEIGATFGTAYSRASNSLFASAFMKRHTAFGPGGTGAIYKIDLNGEVPTAPISSTGVSTFLDLNSLFGTNTAGVNPHPNGSNFNRDSDSYDAVGKRGLGGLALSETDNVLWTINLADRRLYEIPLGGTPNNPTAPASMAAISRWPATGDLTGLPGLTGTASDIRPFAVKCYRGEIYIGLVNTAESTVVFNAATNTLTNTGDRSAMRGFIYKFNPDTDTFTKLLEFPLNYTRGQAIDFCGNNAQGEFYPWTPIFDSDVMLATVMGTTSPPGGNFIGERAYPQPWLTDIEFDEAGKMIIGIRDRFADQHGYNRLPPSTMEPNVQFTADAAGDILVASINTTDNTTYVLENNSSNGTNGAPFGPTTGINKAEGPGNGEFFFDDRYRPANAPGDGPANCPGGSPDTNDEDPILNPNRQQGHDETSLGGVFVHNGQLSVIMTNYDPLNDWNLPFNNAGMMELSTTTGARTGGNQIYATPSDPGTFAKGNGLGDVEGVGGRAPIEIGNRLWLDANNNGRQDADEDGINGVTVRLFKDVGGGNFNEVASTTTAANAAQGNGFFIFSSETDADVLPGMNYEIRVDLADVQAVENTVTAFTTTDAGGNMTNDNKTDLNDSDASSAGVIAFSTGAAGQNNHTLDLGVVAQPVCSITVNSATPGPCVPATNEYTLEVEVTYSEAPMGENIVITTDNGASQSFMPSGAMGMQTFTLTGLTSDGMSDIDVTATFETTTTCTDELADAYDAPADCSPVCSITVNSASPRPCVPSTNEYTLDVEVTYSDAPMGENIVITTDNGASQSFMPSGTAGMQIFTLTGLTSDGVSDIDVTATFETTTTCTDDLVDAY
ncbi:MAG: SdrD B-like domain-containing protein, partial [Bacteroidota bacterium]